MSSNAFEEWLGERPTPFTITVSRLGAAWYVTLWDLGYTMSERLNPRQIAAQVIPEGRAAELRTNRELLAEMASMAIDLADGIRATTTV